MTFKTREEFFLAKMAGYDVDISTLTPPVPVNATERLMLEIAGRLDKAPESSEATNNNTANVGTLSIKLTSSYDASSDTVQYSMDKTFEEIAAAYNDGMTLRCMIQEMVGGPNGYTSSFGYLAFATCDRATDELYQFGFMFFSNASYDAIYGEATINKDNNVTFATKRELEAAYNL